MELSNLKPAVGSTHSIKRIGRGQGSGRGGTATRGHKGDKARSGHKNKRAHEGGQTPMQRRLPKFGFTNFNRVEYVAINLTRLQEFADKYGVTEISAALLYKNGVTRRDDLVKVLASGELTSKLTITAHAFSEAAKIAVEKSGGSLTVA
jgi:large subunit ribosomal protein L15